LLTLSPSVRKISVKLLRLRDLTVKKLQQSGIDSVGKLVDVGYPWTIGPGYKYLRTLADIEGSLRALSRAIRPDGGVDWKNYAASRNVDFARFDTSDNLEQRRLSALKPSVRSNSIRALALRNRGVNVLERSGITSIGLLIDVGRPWGIGPRQLRTLADIEHALRALSQSIQASGEVDWLHYAALRTDVSTAEGITRAAVQRRSRTLYFFDGILEPLGTLAKSTNITALHLSSRAVNSLNKLGVESIGDLPRLVRNGPVKLPRGGTKVAGEVLAMIDAVVGSINLDGVIDLEDYASRRGIVLLPTNGHSLSSVEAILRAFPQALNAAVSLNYGPRGSLIFRNNLLGHGITGSSLRNISQQFSRTPQAMSLQKTCIVEMLQRALFESDYTDCRFRFRDVFVAPFQRLSERLNWARGLALRESEWKRAVADTWAVDPAKLGALDNVLRAILGLQLVHPSGRRFEPIILPRSKRTATFAAAQIKIERLLRTDFPNGLTTTDLLEQLKRLGEVDLTLPEIPTLIHSIPGLEYCERRKLFRLRTEMLSSLADQLERVLDEKGSPMHRRELTLEVGAFKRRAGSLRTGRHVALAMSRDQRFRAIGRSGFWTLAKWGLETGDVADVAARCLGESDRPLTEGELFSLIASRRPVKFDSIMSALREDGRFRRVAPRTWELKQFRDRDA